MPKVDIEPSSDQVSLTRNRSLMIGIALLMGLLASYLFFQRSIGVSVPVYIALSLSTLYGLANVADVKPAWHNSWLAAALFFFSIMVAVRAEAFTSFLNVCAMFLLALLLANRFTGRSLLAFGFFDYLKAGIVSIVQIILSLPPSELAALIKSRKGSASPHVAGVLRGLLLAIPILLVFIALLSSADAAFAIMVDDLQKRLRLDNIPELISRLVFSLITAWAMLGGLSYALRTQKEESPPASSTSLRAPLGITESAVVLGSVDLLFSIFVGVQLRYFFGGQINIHVAGLTYSEYARRGFAELVVVAVFSLGLAMLLQWLTKRKSRRSVVAFEVLAGLLTLLTGVILISGFQRLLLYEQAYGFTELRFFTHVFMVWMGVLLIIYLISLHVNKSRWFTFGLLLVVLGFIATLNLLNTDAYIVRQNLLRYETNGDLDSAYLATLSDDAIPILLQALEEVGSADKAVLGSALHYRLNQLAYAKENQGWMEWHLAHSRAYRMLLEAKPTLQRFEPQEYYWEFPLD